MNTKLFSIVISFFCCGIIFSQNLKIYVSDANGFTTGPWQILQYDEDGSNPKVFIDEEISWPQDILFIPEENEVLISNLNTNRITKYEGATGEYIEDFATVEGGPTRMKIGPDGLLYVLQWSQTDNKVLRYQLDGNFLDEFTSVGVSNSIGMDWDSAGNLYVSSYNGNEVRKFDASGNDVGVFIDSNLNGPTNLEILNNGDILVLNWGGGNVARFDSNGNFIDIFIDGLSQPEGIDFLSNGNILIGNGGLGEVKQYLVDGTFVENTVMANSGGLQQPNAVVLFDPATLSITEKEEKKVFVTPTVGNEFVINTKALNSFQEIEVFDVSGKSITKILKDETIWDASHLNEGIYFLVVASENKKITQKIVVKK